MATEAEKFPFTRLLDADTNEILLASELKVTDEQYAAGVAESAALNGPNDTGIIRVNGRRVYAY